MDKESKDFRHSPFTLILSSVKMASATLVSRILGLVREQVMAFTFGASGVTDAFLVAYRIPNLLRDLFAEGAFSSAFVPVFTEKIRDDPQGARRLLWTLFICLLLVTGAISLVIAMAAPGIVTLFAPGFVQEPGKFQLTVLMVRIMAPFLTLVSLAALFMGALNALKVFFVPALAPAVFNVVMIVSMLVAGFAMVQWGESMGIHPIIMVAIGVCLGGLAQALIQLPLLLARKMGPGPLLRFSDAAVKKVFKKLGPGLLGLAATQINLIVGTALATSAAIGAVSWLSFAFRLFQLPVGLMGVSVANSNLVLFSEAWKAGERERALSTLRQALHFVLFLLLPSMILLWALALPMVQVLFERGEFFLEDSIHTANALKYYALALPLYGIYKIFVPVFYILDRERIAVWGSVVSIAFNITFCVILVPRYGFEVLAMGMSLSILVNITIQGIALKSLLDCPWTLFFDLRVAKMSLATALCGGAVLLAMKYFSLAITTTWERLLALVVYASLGVIAYFAALVLMGEGAVVKRIVKKFLS